MNPAARGVGVALGAVTFMIWTGVTASAGDGGSVADDAVGAIEAVAGQSLDNSIDVSSADSTISAGHGMSVDLSSNASDGILMDRPTGDDLEIGLPFAGAADGAKVVDGVMVYDNGNGSSTTPLVQDDGSVQILATVSDSSAPTSFEYTIEAASAGALLPTEDGGIDVVDADGLVVSHVGAPWATDADGNPVATRYAVTGKTVSQFVDHGPGTAYPVVADPSVSFGWKVYVKYSKSEVKTLTSGWIGNVADKAKYTAILCVAAAEGGAFVVAACSI